MGRSLPGIFDRVSPSDVLGRARTALAPLLEGWRTWSEQIGETMPAPRARRRSGTERGPVSGPAAGLRQLRCRLSAVGAVPGLGERRPARPALCDPRPVPQRPGAPPQRNPDQDPARGTAPARSSSRVSRTGWSAQARRARSRPSNEPGASMSADQAAPASPSCGKSSPSAIARRLRVLVVRPDAHAQLERQRGDLGDRHRVWPGSTRRTGLTSKSWRCRSRRRVGRC